MTIFLRILGILSTTTLLSALVGAVSSFGSGWEVFLALYYGVLGFVTALGAIAGVMGGEFLWRKRPEAFRRRATSLAAGGGAMIGLFLAGNNLMLATGARIAFPLIAFALFALAAYYLRERLITGTITTTEEPGTAR
ncbi:hypothetical protein [Jonesia quinghaiensis]|uniref:hypothetical protein n=1 Tax=Jonesia quinghaiensis TaxID=262806 RepID=UPI000418DC3F|nr:hypothetical protein [Jonesia quinghaiensis]